MADEARDRADGAEPFWPPEDLGFPPDEHGQPPVHGQPRPVAPPAGAGMPPAGPSLTPGFPPAAGTPSPPSGFRDLPTRAWPIVPPPRGNGAGPAGALRTATDEVPGTPWAQPPHRAAPTPTPAPAPAPPPPATGPPAPVAPPRLPTPRPAPTPPTPPAAAPAPAPAPPPPAEPAPIFTPARPEHAAGVPPHSPHPGVVEVPHPGVHPVPRAAQDQPWTPDAGVPTADDFARRRAARPAEPAATTGMRAALNKGSLGLVKLPPGRLEQELRQDVEMVRRNFGGLRQVTVVNPKGGAGKTVAILLLAMTFGQKRGGYVLAWDNNETQGTLGMRAQQDFHSRTVRDLLRDLGQFRGAHGRVGDLSQYVRAQGEGMFDVLASDESATAGEMLTAAAFADLRDVVSRFYKLIFVDTGNNVRAQNWQAAIDATDQLVVTMSARNDSAETAARMLDHLEQTGRHRLVRQAVTVVSMPPSRREIDLPPIERHFAARTRAVLLAPYERLIDAGEPIAVRGADHRFPYRMVEDRRRRGGRPVAGRRVSRPARQPASASAAAGSQSRTNWAQRAASSDSPISSAARPST